MGLGSVCWCVCACVCVCVCVCALSHVQLFVTPWTSSPPDSSVHGIFQARILEWVAISSPGGTSWPRMEPVSPAVADRFFTTVPPGESQHVVHFLLLVGVWVSANNSRAWLRILSLALEEGLKVLDFALWLKLYFLLLDYFPSFLPFSHFSD